MEKSVYNDALRYHEKGRPGKIEVVPTKPHETQYDLSLAYTPGVAQPCREIQQNPEEIYRYTSKGNLVAVVSNGTAVLGLGDIGPAAGKPVMEGKGMLFKIFADVDVFDIEVNEKDPDRLIEVVKAISPTFGGINLEDIKAPECFYVEEKLKAQLDIPVFHDDQHGTAIISGAALLNSLEITGKNIADIRVVISGAGAAAISCAKLYVQLGVKQESIVMFDSRGALSKSRTDLNEAKKQFACDMDYQSLADAMDGADLFLGLSVGNLVSADMVRLMAKDPVVFAMANPTPEIAYDEATSVRDDIIMATGRSDFPNQINNVLGFPFIFRGALDVRAREINEPMKIAAVKALAALAKKYVPELVTKAYNMENIVFGKEYIIPKPLDPRLITTVAPAVARAAMETGVARKPIENWDDYERELSARLGSENKLIMTICNKAKLNPKRVVFADANNLKMLKAARFVQEQGIAHPILLGKKAEIQKILSDNKIELDGVPIIDIFQDVTDEKRQQYARLLFEKRKRKGMSYDEALEKMDSRDYFGCMMVETGEADAFISGFSRKYADTIRPAIHVIGTKEEFNHIAGMYIMLTPKGPLFLADTTVNSDPAPQTIADTTVLVANEVRRFKIEPRIAVLSYSNFGAFKGKGSPVRASEAVKILHQNYPDLIVDGEMQANYALNGALRQKKFPFTKLGDADANVLIFPNLSSGNILYKVLQELGTAKALGPILLGMKKPIHVLQMESSVREIVNLVAIAVVDAQEAEITKQT
ncbi:NADP-dependent malic enzyme [Mangrovibacterium diazotrophicum]|uniref:Allosteric NADP-dependent malic enzyme n=1 Tax=Mangrovibacterium diazotrophicum TaxID=1261403 RepID=A0A419WBQ4_9BACT|nr:NADP-dependent malic enzyme [Mangrovibacterium diazotrophicum]RKD92893.1 allosteric NADP-dependent malic enzyme [Mangrovibacterium diazotrophicum]